MAQGMVLEEGVPVALSLDVGAAATNEYNKNKERLHGIELKL